MVSRAIFNKIYLHLSHVFLLQAVITLMLWAWTTPGPANADGFFLHRVRNRIERQVKIEIQQKGFTCQGEIICGLQAIPTFYAQRDFRPVWIDGDGLRASAGSLLQAIREADQDGLNPSDYHLGAIDRLIETLGPGRYPPDDAQAKQWADLDLILTDGFLLLGTHLSGGRINPENIHADWLIGPRSFDMLTVLNAGLTEAHIRRSLDRFRPAHEGYVHLKVALQRMRRLASQGGWPRIQGAERSVRPMETDESVADVRRLLSITGDYQEPLPTEQPDLYDVYLVEAVKRFQSRHGLEPDGIIGKKTQNAMNITVDRRIRQIELNLERWRWLPKGLGGRYVFVNTAAFFLKVIENDQKELEMKVVVGRPARQSPVFSSTITYMVLNPYWNVPYKIALEDILPKLADGVDYLINQKFKVFADWSEGAEELAPETVDWKSYNEHYFPLRLRQEPGRLNALGQIKFMFPNDFAVYLHDTPQKSLFEKSQRDFSSGCIRVEDARALAAYLLSDSPAWTRENLIKTLEEGQRRVVHIPDPIAIHLVYMTAWVDERGDLQFREDIYERDSMLDTALINRNPYPLPPLTAAKDGDGPHNQK